MNENALVPDQAGQLPNGPWLVFAPHPDDETFGMGGTILHATAANIEVCVIFLTDGSQAISELDQSQLIATREDEAKSACSELGVADCQFWRQPDRSLRSSEALINRVVSLIRAKKPQTVFAPSVLEFHPDHRATADIVWQGLKKASLDADQTPLLALYDITTLGPCNLLIDISAFTERKRAVMGLYQSQVSEHKYIELVQSLNTARTLSLSSKVTAAESFFTIHPTHYATLSQAIQPWVDRHFKRIEYDEPLVSVIIRTQGRTEITQALASLVDQTHQNLEVIIVNDGGTPNAVVNDFSNSFTKFNIIKNASPRGRAHAANQGMAAASGAFFMFLDDDDWLSAQHVNKLVAAHQEAECLVAYTGVRAVKLVGNDLVTERVFNQPFDRNRLYYENYIPINAALIHRKAIDNGLKMDTAFDVFEDWDFWLQLCQYTVEFSYVSGVSAQYRISDSQGIGVRGDHKQARRRIYARWAKTWGADELDDLMTRLHLLSKLQSKP